MIGSIRETGLVAPLMGGALMASVLVGVSACAELPFRLGEQTGANAAEAAAASAAAQHVPAPEERMPPPFEAAEPQSAPPMPREKPALLLTVANGDSVSVIAQRYRVEAVAIIALNELSHPYWLRTGQRLALPREAPDVAWRNGSPHEAPRPVQGEAAITISEIGEEAVTPTRAEPDEPARAEAAAPAPLVYAEPAAPQPPDSPGPRVARVESGPTASTLTSLARKSESVDVPLPPTRNTFLWPIEGRVISGFGAKPGGKHNDGINIAVPVGSEVRAAQSGVVAYAGNELRGYGNLVLIRHDGGWMTAYAHNDSLLVGKGELVRRGQVISHSGKTGGVSRPQAHFEIRRDGEPKDPLRLLTRR